MYFFLDLKVAVWNIKPKKKKKRQRKKPDFDTQQYGKFPLKGIIEIIMQICVKSRVYIWNHFASLTIVFITMEEIC